MATIWKAKCIWSTCYSLSCNHNNLSVLKTWTRKNHCRTKPYVWCETTMQSRAYYSQKLEMFPTFFMHVIQKFIQECGNSFLKCSDRVCAKLDAIKVLSSKKQQIDVNLLKVNKNKWIRIYNYKRAYQSGLLCMPENITEKNPNIKYV